MENRRETNGWQTFMEHWGFTLNVLLGAIGAMACFKVLDFFHDLGGRRWICFFIASEILLFLGAGLIMRAKIPVYRNGRFFTFGLKSVPKNLQGCYRWGWRVFLFGVVLSLCLLLSKQ